MGDVQVRPWHDCPPCPSCSLDVGTPIADCAGDPTTDRHRGPDGSTCWCPACGMGWIATPEDLGRARRALHAWYVHEGRTPPTPCACPPPPPDPRQMALPGT